MYSLTYYCCKCDLQFPIGSNKTICPKCGQDVTKQQIAGIRIPYKEPSNLDTIKELREDNNLLTRKLQAAIATLQEVEGWCMPARETLKTIEEMK